MVFGSAVGEVALAMPLHWTIDPQQNLITVVAEGEVARAEFEALLDDIDAADAHTFRKLFDGAHGDTRMRPGEILELGARMRAIHGRGGRMGPLAAVVPDDKAELVARVLGILATADRPMRVFSGAAAALKWLGDLPRDLARQR